MFSIYWSRNSGEFFLSFALRNNGELERGMTAIDESAREGKRKKEREFSFAN